MRSNQNSGIKGIFQKYPKNILSHYFVTPLFIKIPKNYPKFSPTRQYYDSCRLPEGGYGGLLSATFHSVADAQVFYDHLECQKGPSLGTNFTLASPFVLLAHYGELEWAAGFGCEESLVRFSVGLEETGRLVRAFEFVK